MGTLMGTLVGTLMGTLGRTLMGTLVGMLGRTLIGTLVGRSLRSPFLRLNIVFNLNRTSLIQHGVQLVGQVVEHVADVVQDGPC